MDVFFATLIVCFAIVVCCFCFVCVQCHKYAKRESMYIRTISNICTMLTYGESREKILEYTDDRIEKILRMF